MQKNLRVKTRRSVNSLRETKTNLQTNEYIQRVKDNGLIFFFYLPQHATDGDYLSAF